MVQPGVSARGIEEENDGRALNCERVIGVAVLVRQREVFDEVAGFGGHVARIARRRVQKKALRKERRKAKGRHGFEASSAREAIECVR